MQSTAKTRKEYSNSLPEDRRQIIEKLRAVILKNIPEGFSEVMAYGMPTFVVPHSLYPAGYHVDPKQPLPFISIASQKNHVALYHMGIYVDKELLDWFICEYPKHVKNKLNMGKSCIRFNKTEDIPFQLIGELVSKMTPQRMIDLYESGLKK